MQSSPKQTPKKRGKSTVKSIAELVGSILEPVLARRAGMTLDLLRVWPEIAGQEFRETTRPEKIDWPRRIHEDDPFKPATLVIACEPSSALFLQHEQTSILERINTFLGFRAIDRIKILQKPVRTVPAKPATAGIAKSLSVEQEARLDAMLEAIDDPELKGALKKLGRGVLSKHKEV